jgi:hypothetical protein
MGQNESQERGFKEGFKELQGVRPKRIKNREKKQLELGVSTRAPNTPDPTFCLSCVFSESPVAPKLRPVRFGNNQEHERKSSPQQRRERKRKAPSSGGQMWLVIHTSKKLQTKQGDMRL